jgi:hypothetical protein
LEGGVSKTSDKKKRKQQIRLLRDMAKLYRQKAVACCGLAVLYEQEAQRLQSETTEPFSKWQKSQPAWDEHVMVPLSWLQPEKSK